MISNDQIFSSFNKIRGIPQYFHNSMDSRALMFLIKFDAKFHWTQIIQVIALQYGDKIHYQMNNKMQCIGVQ